MALTPQYESKAKSIFRQLAAAKRPLLISHGHPDGDTLGAALALLEWFRSRDIPARAFCVDRPDGSSAHLPGLAAVTTDQAVLDDPAIDLLVFVDCADLVVTGLAERFAEMIKRLPSVNIDHHSTNPNFARENLIPPAVTSASEVVYEMLQKNGVPVTRNMATCLLTGILFDTANFGNAATTERGLEIAAELVLRGAAYADATRQLYRDKTPPALKIWGLALERLRFDPATGIASTALKLEDFQALGLALDTAGGLSNFLLRLLDAPIALVLREAEGGKVTGSYRATGDADVAALAKKYGGGGHRKAAGFTIAGRIEEYEKGWRVAPAAPIS